MKEKVREKELLLLILTFLATNLFLLAGSGELSSPLILAVEKRPKKINLNKRRQKFPFVC